MADLDIGTIPSFETFLKEDAKKISDANHHKKTGDKAHDPAKEDAILKTDKGQTGAGDTEKNFDKANNASLDHGTRQAAKPDKTVTVKLTEGEEKEEGEDGDEKDE